MRFPRSPSPDKGGGAENERRPRFCGKFPPPSPTIVPPANGNAPGPGGNPSFGAPLGQRASHVTLGPSFLPLRPGDQC